MWLTKQKWHVHFAVYLLVRVETKHSWVEAGMYWWSIVKNKRFSKSPWLIARDLSLLPEPCQQLGAAHLHNREKQKHLAAHWPNSSYFPMNLPAFWSRRWYLLYRGSNCSLVLGVLFPIKTTQHKCKPWKSMQYWKLQKTLQELNNCWWCT